MEKGRGRLEPPDLSEKGGLKGGQPQRSDERLFMQLLVFGSCAEPKAVAHHLAENGIEGVVYEDLNDPRGIGVLTLSQAPETFVDRVRPALNAGPCATLVQKQGFSMFGR